MAENPSRDFEVVLKGLEEQVRSYTEKRRSYTKNLVTQTNEEARSGMPYVVDVAAMIANANGSELFLDGLINKLRSDARTIGEGAAVKRALASVMEQVKLLDPGERSGDVVAADLYTIGRFLLDSLGTVELRSTVG